MANTITKNQEKQIAFLERMEAREQLGDGRSYDFTCRDCKVSTVFHCATTVRLLVEYDHHGHRTWVQFIR